MIIAKNITVSAVTGDKGLPTAVANRLGIDENNIRDLKILKRSIDARKKSDVRFVYAVTFSAEDEHIIVLKNPASAAVYSPPRAYSFPYSGIETDMLPVIVGAGPAGLFAALSLCEAGVRCVLLEQGAPVEDRVRDVERFWKDGVLNPTSNVQFGEGGAGTFSDGKLTTGISDSRVSYALRRFVGFGAPEDILYLAKPHIGTDRLRGVVISLREKLLSLGCDIRFGHRLTDIDVTDGKVRSITASSPEWEYTLETPFLILAPGNSARDTFYMLEKRGVTLSSKPFSVGVRIEHLQKNIDRAQYGSAVSPSVLPTADYKLAVHLPNGRSVYTFCVCPGGTVVAAASEAGGVVTNGMSEYARAGKNINGGILVSVTPEDCGGEPLGGIALQRTLEKAAFEAGGGDYRAPAQLVGDFLSGNASTCHKSVKPSFTAGVKYTNLWEVLPQFVCEAIRDALPEMEKKVSGFSNPDAVLTAIETRSSCPIRINREDFKAVGIEGLYPCGEGAGYAGGITSSVVDGIKCAEAVCQILAGGQLPQPARGI